MEIRKTTLQDAPKIETLMKSVEGFWDNGWRNNVLQIALKNNTTISFVTVENELIIGFVCAHDVGFRAYLSELVVHPDHHSKGIGRQLLKAVEDELQFRGCEIFITDIWKDAETFYEKQGWSRPDIVLMRKKLGLKA